MQFIKCYANMYFYVEPETWSISVVGLSSKMDTTAFSVVIV